MLQKIKIFQFSKKSRRFIFFIYWDWNWTYLQWWHRDGGKPEKLSIWDHVSHDFTSKLISMTNKFVLWMKNKNKEFLGLSKCNSKKWRKNNCKYWKWPLTNYSGTRLNQWYSRNSRSISAYLFLFCIEIEIKFLIDRWNAFPEEIFWCLKILYTLKIEYFRKPT